MKAQILQRIELKTPRTQLETVIPLQTPFVLMVDPASHCNFRCRFCPTGDRNLIRSTGRYQGELNFEQFKKIIDDLEEFPTPVKVLRLYKEGEPLLNRRFADMIRYAKASKKILRVDTTTNGALLNPKLNREIIDAGLDQINISINGVAKEHFMDLTKSRVDFEKFVDNIRDLYENKGQCEIYLKGIKENLAPQDQEKFFEIFGDLADRIYLEHLSPAWPGYQFDNIEMKFETGHYGQPILERKVCPYIFYIMVINSDGTVSLCVQDWSRKLVVGDTREQSVREIWQGEAINTHRIAHLEMKRKENPTCGVCSVMAHGVLDNIDAFAPQILEKMKVSL